MDESLWNELMQAAFRFDPDRLWKSGIAVLLMIAVLIAMRVAFKAFKKRSHIGSDVKKYHFFLTAYRIMKVFVIITAVMGILSINGVNVTSFSMLFGVFAAMIVFAVKDSFQDIFAGFTIMLDKYFSGYFEKKEKKKRKHRDIMVCSCRRCNSMRLTEHARWNAYMRVNGYIYAAIRNDRAKCHNDIKPWNSCYKCRGEI